MHAVTKYGTKYIFIKKKLPSVLQAADQKFHLSLSTFDFTGAADSVVFFLFTFHMNSVQFDVFCTRQL
jgi:hypothetical protein